MQLTGKGRAAGRGDRLWRHRHAVLSFVALFALEPRLVARAAALSAAAALQDPGRPRPALAAHAGRRLIITSEIVLGFARGRRQHPARAPDQLLAHVRAERLPADRVPADHPQDRHRAVVHHLVRLRLDAEAAAGVPAVASSRSWSAASPASSRSTRTSSTSRARPARGRWRMFRKIRLPQALPRHLHRAQGRRGARRHRGDRRRVRRLRPGPRLHAARVQRQSRDRMVFATVFVLSLIGLALYYAVEFVERRRPWHVSQRDPAEDARPR